jgi:exosortase
MDREKSSPPITGQTGKTMPALPPWQAWLMAALLAGLCAPGLITWILVLSQRPIGENVPQLVTLGILLAFILKNKRDDKVDFLRIQPSPIGMGLVALAGLIYLLGLWISVKAVIFSGLLFILASFCWAWLGQKAFSRALPAFLFALFLLPQFPTDIRTAISLPLQLISTQLATGLASLFITIQTQGNIFYVKGEAFEVTAACSGLNTWTGYLFAGMLAMLMGQFSFGRLGRLLLGAPLLALGGNAIRLWITAMVAYWVSADTAMAIHTDLEYVIFPLGLLTMVLTERQIGRFLAKKQQAEQPDTPENTDTTAQLEPATGSENETASAYTTTENLITHDAAPPEALQPATQPTEAPPGLARVSAGLLWITIALLLLLNLGAWAGNGLGIGLTVGLNSGLTQPASTSEQETASLPAVPYQMGAWHGKELPLLHNEAAILAPATVTSREYTIGSAQPGQPILWMNLLEARSMNALHNVVDSLIASGAKPKLKGTIIIDTRKGPLKASWYICREPNGQPYHLLLWYEWDGGTAENRWTWYWHVLQLKLQRKQPIWRLVELATPGSPSESGPEQSRKLEQLKTFAADIYTATVP